MSALQEIINKQKAEAEQAHEKATTQSAATSSETSSETTKFPVFDLAPEGLKDSIGDQTGSDVSIPIESSAGEVTTELPSPGNMVSNDGEAVQASGRLGATAAKALGGSGSSANSTIPNETNGINAESGEGRASNSIPTQSGESNPKAPPRDLPASITEQQSEFVKGLDSVYSCFHDPELLSHTIRNIMAELQKFPKFLELVSDTDVATMVRGMRDTLGMVQLAKAKKKRGSTSKKGEDALAKALKVDNVLDTLLKVGD